MQFVVVTGISGSGKSTAVNVLEDIGYYCIDNMPPELMVKFADICAQSEGKIDKVAFVADVRGGELFLKLKDAIGDMRRMGIKVKVMFLDCSDDVIMRRYKETRRKHPLDEMAHGNIRNAIETERHFLETVRDKVDYYIDTSSTSTAEFKERMYSIFLGEGQSAMQIDVRSFGFKYGVMNDADLTFDVRCLPNPFYIAELKHKTGLNPEVSGYVMKFKEAQDLLAKLNDLIDFLIPLYEKEGKAQLVIAFGCTGGKHRSVTFAEAVAKHLTDNGRTIRLAHRDIEKR
ncbi:RNase adapter RapZ [Ruminococcus sp.]|uniref:RNase adapter RapZ n=1 Tax=Ruminococcus sp. TaxID=41978 RepID=UPI0025EB3A4B|nr:RNase adapter RapZ [Ruminococcus sp.]MBQ8965018.1 RNase adapter RapZ [Ruminococcus sp.]